MNASLLYQAYGVKNYSYGSTEYKDNAIFLNLKTILPQKHVCPHCGSRHVIRNGTVLRHIHNLPFGSKACYLSLRIQRYWCKECEKAWQSDIPFTHGEVSYTYRFSRYVLDLLRMGNTILDVARHLHVGWNMVKGIHKKYLKDKYSRPDIKGVSRIGIDEFATRKGHVYKTIVVDLDTGRIIHVGDGKGKEALAGFWKRVRRNKVKIEIVTSDLSAAFIASVMENVPDAIHVYDKFHVSWLVTDAVDKVRRSVYAQETDLEKRKIIKGARWLLLTKDKNESLLQQMKEDCPQINVTTDNIEAVKDADVIVLVVKPWLMKMVLAEVRHVLDFDRQIIVSDAANFTTGMLAEELCQEGQYFYVIPNIAAEFCASMSFIAQGPKASDDSLKEVEELYGLVGDTLVVDENLVGPGMMMASCGIAYVMRYIRAQMEGGCEMGFYPQQAKQIALQTMQGAVSLLKATGWHPEEAIDKVTTPGGVTIKGLNELDHAGFNSAVIRSLKAGLK
ncbi:MAG: ISL3 family transposase [Bacteroidaceae bacterium]|nr:ISL3 family transposase [Bacteroidaceae bacterium]